MLLSWKFPIQLVNWPSPNKIIEGNNKNIDFNTVLESPGIPVTGPPSNIEGYQKSLLAGSPSIFVL